MKIGIQLEKEDFDILHDVILNALNIETSEEEITEYFMELPREIIGTAVSWGVNDTVFRDEMYEWLKVNKSN
jgi:hypothetical protein